MKARILIVDDEQPVIESISMIIREDFPDCILTRPALSGRQAIDIAATERPDIVLMDINMPGIQGLDALREIRKENPQTVAVIVSAYERFDIAKSAFEIGVHDYLLKPFSRRSVAESLESALERVREISLSQDSDIERLEDTGKLLPLLEANLIQSLAATGEAGAGLELCIRTGFFPAEAKMRVLLLSLPDGGKQLDRLVERVKYKYRCLGSSFTDTLLLFVFAGSIDAEALKNESYWRTLAEACGLSSPALKLSLGDALPREQIGASFLQALSRLEPGMDRRLEEFEELKEELIQILRRKDGTELERVWRRLLTLGGNAAAAAAVAALCALGIDSGQSSRELTRAVLEPKQEYQCGLIFALLKRVAAEGIWRGNTLPPPLQFATEYLESHYAEPLQLRDLAEQLKVSAPYLSQLFSRFLGSTFTEYLTGLRIGRARKMLTEELLPVKDVSLAVGYPDPNYFSRIFKRHTGRTPREYMETGGDR